MGSEISTQQNQGDGAPPTPSTVRSFPEETSPSVRSPPIDLAQQSRGTTGPGRLSRFLSDAIPTVRTNKPPIPQEIHVVREGATEGSPAESDPDLEHLRSLPTFLPLVKTSVNVTAVKDPELGDRLDYRKILMIGLRYQQYLRQCSDIVGVEQHKVIARIKEADEVVSRETSLLSEKQKLLSRYADTFGSVSDVNKTLDRIQENLAKTVDLMDTLNHRLPPEYQLSAFNLDP
ncbi:hypothetical protein RvY_08889 [Ramazzottius varieornatus]|uniref:BLOC-1-related complex subunit 5 n=1 Tax=Ramazzottius varieornatus TaxID=947166 RepID=A0A1D1VFF6_RAMVA|nr:hypothetical protein RvY_08889 [Ramazzottius varieornatus]